MLGNGANWGCDLRIAGFRQGCQLLSARFLVWHAVKADCDAGLYVEVCRDGLLCTQESPAFPRPRRGPQALSCEAEGGLVNLHLPPPHRVLTSAFALS